MLLPYPRGPISAQLIAALARRDVALLPDPTRLASSSDALTDDDLQLALWVCFELHYRGFDDVPDQWEWQPEVIAVRRVLEDDLLAALRRQVTVRPDDRPVAMRLRDLVDSDDGPQLSRFMQQEATRAQYVEFAKQRSLYQLKEADPHTWAIPRLAGAAKVALVEIQVDEYGDGDPDQMHSALYRKLLRGLGLDDGYGTYVDDVPGITLAISNVMSLFGLRRELRGALVGHLAAYEMTSSEPCRRYAKGLHRLGIDDGVGEFYDVHVTADALHEQIAAHDLCGGLADAEPELTEDIVFGAAACLYVDNVFARYVLDAWAEGRSSLRNDEAVEQHAVPA